ncbi:DNA polymerase III subunit chi [Teredinibacter franksiae]|uniref:DNA polymerase III subunit chi n=1 Tax=Teredinibacter franksiae TaxID=2761453 RepID=UPI001625F72C|nr:DNA polymerase III subunit chi [Teredinibacter franksiae]
MTRVNFYILQANEVVERHRFVCRLVQKAINESNRVLVATSTPEETFLLDELLWSFKPESFIPHSIVGEPDTEKVPVVISHTSDSPTHHDLLINLRAIVPPEFSRFKKLAEVVVQQTDILQSTRENWKFYKDRGYELTSFKI